LYHSTLVTSTPNDGSFTWGIPIDFLKGIYRVCLYDADDLCLYEVEHRFGIIGPTPNTLICTSPDGGAAWITGSIREITWTSTGSISNVRIELYKSGILVATLAESTPNDGSFSWTAPDTLARGDDYAIKITSMEDAGVTDACESFSISSSDQSGDRNLGFIIGATVAGGSGALVAVVVVVKKKGIRRP
jgi:hypothetical protein